VVSQRRGSTVRTYDRGVGLSTNLGYEYQAPNWAQRVVARIGTTRVVSSFSRVVMPGLDRFTLRVSGGRSTATTWLLGIPTLWLTTRGARSGEPRRVPLFGIPIDDDLALLGTRFGYQSTPSWVFNIEANPEVEIAYRGRTARAAARLAAPDEESRIWERAGEIYPGYLLYADRAPHRQIRVFVIESR
jgi:deazaflavin-dependent oxidoreductase (nitroreductase family)